MIWLWLSAAFMVTAAGVHSVLGYRRLIVPLLQRREGPLSDALTRRIIRFAWHATAVLMLISASAVIWPGTPRGLLIVIGAGWLATGLVNAAYTKGRHIAWPALCSAGIFALVGALA
ncbi:hypothetical protein [Sphingopyxis sp. JAI128]|uniref:hypothetical protein n=1 Tax=Sphingopyxis sp. JAI128 TaxID=2723066 RepID=UPI00161C3204|nr:hypothetical protein [Sphingopyxis sp. JAI128]MBB6424438.1 putative anti-sigma-YlaC factor YlaD [Sphingopyxis sp. JAI128]